MNRIVAADAEYLTVGEGVGAAGLDGDLVMSFPFIAMLTIRECLLAACFVPSVALASAFTPAISGRLNILGQQERDLDGFSRERHRVDPFRKVFGAGASVRCAVDESLLGGLSAMERIVERRGQDTDPLSALEVG